MLSQFQGWGAYAFLASILAGTSLGVPLSSDLLLIVAGLLASLHFFEISWVIPTAIFGIFLGDFLMFHVGHYMGDRVLAFSWVQKIFPPAKQEKIKSVLQKNPKKYCASIRFTPTLRCLLILMAGMSRIPFAVFFKIHYSITLVYVTTVLSLSYVAAESAQDLFMSYQSYATYFSLAVLGLLFWWAIRFWSRRHLA